jgi:membrane carboxypeptidase/penicillin-binding protein PbpC
VCAYILVVWVGGDANDTAARQAGKVAVLVLLRDGPRDKVARSTLAARQPTQHRLLRDLSLQRHLPHKHTAYAHRCTYA